MRMFKQISFWIHWKMAFSLYTRRCDENWKKLRKGERRCERFREHLVVFDFDYSIFQKNSTLSRSRRIERKIQGLWKQKREKTKVRTILSYSLASPNIIGEFVAFCFFSDDRSFLRLEKGCVRLQGVRKRHHVCWGEKKKRISSISQRVAVTGTVMAFGSFLGSYSCANPIRGSCSSFLPLNIYLQNFGSLRGVVFPCIRLCILLRTIFAPSLKKNLKKCRM